MNEVHYVESDIPAVTPMKKKKVFKIILFSVIGVVFTVLAILSVFMFSKYKEEYAKSNINYALYVKDDEILYYDLQEGGTSLQLTTRFIDDAENEDISGSATTFGSFSYLNDDGTLIFFPDRVSSEEEGFSLYYRELDAENSDATKIDSNVITYSVNNTDTLVTYLEGEEGNLYQYSLETNTKEKIASNIEDFMVSDDGKKLAFFNAEGGVYVKYEGCDKEKLASDVTRIVHVTDDFKTMYYFKENDFYKQTEGEDKIKIDSDVGMVINVYDSGEVYYSKVEVVEKSLYDFVDDDMENKDSHISKPVLPSIHDYDTYSEYSSACLDYENDLSAYYAKEERDEFRDELSKEIIELSFYSLFYFDGANSTELADCIRSTYYCEYSLDTPIVSYPTCDKNFKDKIKFSEVAEAYDVREFVWRAKENVTGNFVAIKNVTSEIEDAHYSGFKVNSSGTDIYYFEESDEEQYHSDLYHITVTEGVLSQAELYDTEVYIEKTDFLSDSEFMYFKDTDAAETQYYTIGDLYINKKCIDYDVYIERISYYEQWNKLVYYTDCNIDKALGTIKYYFNGETVKVSDDVYIYNNAVSPDGTLLYLYDFSLNYYKGELRTWIDGANAKLDDDVVCVFPFYDGRKRELVYDYGWY